LCKRQSADINVRIGRYCLIPIIGASVVLSQVDYCNSSLAGLHAIALAPLERLLNAATHYVADLRPLGCHLNLEMRNVYLSPLKSVPFTIKLFHEKNDCKILISTGSPKFITLLNCPSPENFWIKKHNKYSMEKSVSHVACCMLETLKYSFLIDNAQL